MAAGQSSGNLIVMDADFLCAAETINKCGDKFKGVIDQYKQIMFYISAHGFVDGLITSNILEIEEEVDKYTLIVDGIVNQSKMILESFAKEIDSNDNFKY